MSTVPCANYRRTFTTERMVGDKVQKVIYELNTTSRKVDSMTIAEKKDLIVKTTKLWLYIAKAIENGQRELPAEIAFKSAEMAMENDNNTELVQHNEPRVTIFDWNHQLELTLHSSSLPQPTLEEWWAMDDAQKELEKLYPRNTPQSNVAPQNSNATPPTEEKMATPKSQNPPQGTPVEGAIVATRAPSKARQYADGQLVQFNINKIVKGTNKGSVTYNLWGDLGKNYALKTIYMTKSGSDEKSQDYIASRDILEGLNLSVDAGKIEAHGDWKMVTKVAHGKNGKGEETEFFNVVSLTAI